MGLIIGLIVSTTPSLLALTMLRVDRHISLGFAIGCRHWQFGLLLLALFFFFAFLGVSQLFNPSLFIDSCLLNPMSRMLRSHCLELLDGPCQLLIGLHL